MQVYYKNKKSDDKVDIKEFNEVIVKNNSNENNNKKINDDIINNSSIASNVNINKTKNNLKEKNKTVNNNPLNMNKIISFDSKDIFTNIAEKNEKNNDNY